MKESCELVRRRRECRAERGKKEEKEREREERKKRKKERENRVMFVSYKRNFRFYNVFKFLVQFPVHLNYFKSTNVIIWIRKFNKQNLVISRLMKIYE